LWGETLGTAGDELREAKPKDDVGKLILMPGEGKGEGANNTPRICASR